MPLSADRTQFTTQVRVTNCECDIHSRIKISFILRHMQEISGEHLDALNLAYSKLMGLGQVFLLSKLHMVVTQRPRAGQEVTLRTTPKQPVGAQFIRVNEMWDGQGNLLVRADTAWLLVDPGTRRILRPKEFVADLPMGELGEEGRLAKMRLQPTQILEEAGLHVVRMTELDVNRHMNNANYADVVCDFLPPNIYEEQEPVEFYIHYQNEARLGDCLQIQRAALQGGWYFSAQKADGKCFEAWIRLTENTRKSG